MNSEPQPDIDQQKYNFEKKRMDALLQQFPERNWQHITSFGDPDITVASYLLDIFDVTLPRYRLRNKLKKYVQYLEEELDEWDEQTFDDPRPTILLVCATLTDLIYAKRRTKGLIADIWEYDDEDIPLMRFTTAEHLKERGVLDKDIWEEV